MDKKILFALLAISPLAFGQTVTEEIETASFQQRCFAPDVILCDPLDTEGPYGIGITADTPHADGLPFAGQYRDWRWIEQRASKGIIEPAVMDSTIKASGTGSLKFTISSNSSQGASGYFMTNFTPDNSVQFGPGETFFVQWRQRFSESMLFNEDGTRRKYKVTSGPGGFKTIIVNAGDHSSQGFPTSSCTPEHIVLTNRAQLGALSGYTSCGRYIGFDKYLDIVKGRYQYDIQPGGETQCLKLDPLTGKTLATAGPGCVMLWPNEWMTFQIQITVGKWGEGFPNHSNIKLWQAREGAPSMLVIDRGLKLYKPVGPAGYGKAWLLPYHTNKGATEVHPEAHTWYDEFIVSRSKIPDPAGGCP